jgi:hypothetical protein
MANTRDYRMTHVRLDILRCAAAVFVAALPFAGNSLTPAQTPINVLMITGQSNRYHNWEVGSPIVKRWLEGSRRFGVTVATTPPKGTTPNQDDMMNGDSLRQRTRLP